MVTKRTGLGLGCNLDSFYDDSSDDDDDSRFNDNEEDNDDTEDKEQRHIMMSNSSHKKQDDNNNNNKSNAHQGKSKAASPGTITLETQNSAVKAHAVSRQQQTPYPTAAVRPSHEFRETTTMSPSFNTSRMDSRPVDDVIVLDSPDISMLSNPQLTAAKSPIPTTTTATGESNVLQKDNKSSNNSSSKKPKRRSPRNRTASSKKSARTTIFDEQDMSSPPTTKTTGSKPARVSLSPGKKVNDFQLTKVPIKKRKVVTNYRSSLEAATTTNSSDSQREATKNKDGEPTKTQKESRSGTKEKRTKKRVASDVESSSDLPSPKPIKKKKKKKADTTASSKYPKPQFVDDVATAVVTDTQTPTSIKSEKKKVAKNKSTRSAASKKKKDAQKKPKSASSPEAEAVTKTNRTDSKQRESKNDEKPTEVRALKPPPSNSVNDKVPKENSKLASSNTEVKSPKDRAEIAASKVVAKQGASSTADKRKASTSKSSPRSPGETTGSAKKAPQTKKASSKEATKGSAKTAALVKDKQKTKKKRTFQDQVLSEMFFSCKPYTLKTLARALSTTEQVLKFTLLSLTDKNLVVKKEFPTKKGTPKELYWANLESNAREVKALVATPEEKGEANRVLVELREKHRGQADAMKVLQQELSNTQIDERLTSAEKELSSLNDALSQIKERIRLGTVDCGATKKKVQSRFHKPKSAAQLARERCPKYKKTRINAMRDEWKKRKDKCMTFVDQMADAMEKKPKDVMKLLDIETDEATGVSMPPKYVIDEAKKRK